ncbi:MAG: TonB-dependent receptor [Puniceicoccaceae bacterium]
MLIVPGLMGQGITSSGLGGRVLDASGAGIEGATVQAVHTPTGTTYTSRTRENGRYNFSGVRVGGPYTITATADGRVDRSVSDVYTSLGQLSTINLRMAVDEEEVIELEAFTVEAQSGDYIFDTTNMGVSTNYGSVEIDGTPSTRRHLNDVARLNPFVTLTEEDRNELTALGQSNRFNSVMLDGVRINDQFGLDSSGVQSFRNPVAFDALEAITVELSPYDARRSGFTGAAINAVTKSGTNEFHGSLYGYYYDSGMRGDVNGSNDFFEETTWGATLGGPIIKDKLFFFVYYEEFERVEEGGVPGFDPDPDAIADVLAFNNSLPFDFGDYGAAGKRVQPDEKYLIKLDWNINEKHRLAVKYQNTQGEDPNVGNFDDSGETSLDSHFYRQEREERFYTAQLYSSWTDDFETEISFGYNRYRQPTTWDELIPQIFIDNFPDDDGVPGSYEPTGSGELFSGTEQFRHANNLEVDTYNFSAIGTYYKGNITYTFGVDYEDASFFNLFLESSFANFGFDNIDDYFNGVLNSSSRNNYRNTGVTGQNPVAEAEVSVTGAFVQAAWEVNPKLNVNLGLRMDYTDMGDRPPEAFDSDGVPFEDLFGIPNTGKIDGKTLISPRISFNYKPNLEKDMQIRGGIGIFQGRTPGVWLVNPYTNNGETSNRIRFGDIDGFDWIDYMSTQLDQENPIIYIEKAEGTPEVNVSDPNLSLPWIIRANLAFDYRLGESPWVLTAEVIHTENYDSLYVEDINLALDGAAADGRKIYDGTAVDTYDSVFVLRNVDAGDATNFALSLEREMTGGWFSKLSYVNGSAKDVNPFTSSRATSNYYNRQVFNVNDPEVATSNFEVNHRFLVMAGTQFELVANAPTRITAIFEARSGRPYSVTFDGDINGDGDDNNDLLYIPTGPGDSNVVFEPGFDQDGFFDFVKENGLSKYAGRNAPRNSQYNRWVQRLDIKFEQDIPIWESVGLTFYVDFLNVLNWLDSDWGLTEEFGFPFDQEVVGASLENGKYVFEEFDPESDRVQTGGVRSRWAIQLGARLTF